MSKIIPTSSILEPILNQFWGHFGTYFEIWGLDISNMRTIISVCVFRSSIFNDFVSKWGPH